MPMMLFYIRENSHRQYMLLAHGARQDPVGMSLWSILKILLTGPVSLALGIMVTFHDQPKRHREALAVNKTHWMPYFPDEETKKSCTKCRKS